MRKKQSLQRLLTHKEQNLLNVADSALDLLLSKVSIRYKIKIYLCQLSRNDINTITKIKEREILINLNSPIIQNILSKPIEVQKIILLEELTHEVAHLLGYGLESHDLDFFKKQRVLKYSFMLDCI
ncbi:MAG: hypothetical protein ACFFG0_38755 [Candidatus Thorarchaeota archaeon]